MATTFFDCDASFEPLEKLTIGIIGYGNQGRAHALNLRDSGLNVWIGARQASSSFIQAERDGFVPRSVEEVAANCELLAILLPDEVVPNVFSQSIEPYLEAHDTFVFAHGFSVRHKTIRLPDDADVVLVAPTGPGRQLRSLYEAGKGLPCLVAVDNDASGIAWQRCLAYAKGIGCTRAGAVMTTFEEETITDLFCEQAVLCGGLPELIKASFITLVENGYQSELAYISCLKEVKLIADLLFERGIDGMRVAISNTAKFGSAVAGPKLVDSKTKEKLNELLKDIESGAFAEHFLREAQEGSPTIRSLMSEERHSRLARTGDSLRENLDF